MPANPYGPTGLEYLYDRVTFSSEIPLLRTGPAKSRQSAARPQPFSMRTSAATWMARDFVSLDDKKLVIQARSRGRAVIFQLIGLALCGHNQIQPFAGLWRELDCSVGTHIGA